MHLYLAFLTFFLFTIEHTQAFELRTGDEGNYLDLATPDQNIFPRVDKDIEIYSQAIAAKHATFDNLPVDLNNMDWVKAKLSHMYDIDQYTRNYHNIPKEHSYSEDETAYFWDKFVPIWLNLDVRNTEDLKELVAIWEWFKISVFGEEADREGWLIVQHADHDSAFQTKILEKLETLYPQGETSAKNYAYLFDRVAAAWQHPENRRPQRYGTQGLCVEPGKWEPLPLEEPGRVDQLRSEVGLGPFQDYINEISKYCL